MFWCAAFSILALATGLSQHVWKPDMKLSSSNGTDSDDDAVLDEMIPKLYNQELGLEIDCNGKRMELPLAAKIGSDGIWCPVPKASTSTVFQTASNGKPTNRFGDASGGVEPFDVMKKKGEQKICNFLKSGKSWIVIRNPWDRIRSAYLDKMVDHKGKTNPRLRVPGVANPSFMQFLSHLATLDRHDDSQWDPHAQPVSLRCLTTGPNSFKYQRIIQLESHSFENDLLAAINWSGLKRKELYISHTHDDTHHKDHPEWFGMSNEQFYANNGGHEAIKLVSQIYAEDIKFGGYSFNR